MEFKNSLIHSDCFNVLPLIPDHSINLILADMPYNIIEVDWDQFIINLVLLWQEYMRILTLNGTICLFSSEPFTSRLIMSNLDWYQYKWIWKKHKSSNFSQVKKRPLNNYEEICVFRNNKIPTEEFIYNPILKKRSEIGKNRIKTAQKNNEKPLERKNSNVSLKTNPNRTMINDVKALNSDLKYPELIIDDIPCVVGSSKEHVDHDTQKPIKLYKYFIKTYTYPKMIVLDNFAGSGTNYEACLNLNRYPICIEKESKYIEITKQRLQKRNIILNPISFNNENIKIWQSTNYFQQLKVI